MDKQTVLRDLWDNEVYPAVCRFVSASPHPQTWVTQANFEGFGIMEEAVPSRLGSVMWSFVDHMSHIPVHSAGNVFIATLGVNKDMFWCTILHYALFQGLRDYKAHHRGQLPDDAGAYLFALLTADDLNEAVRHQY